MERDDINRRERAYAWLESDHVWHLRYNDLQTTSRCLRVAFVDMRDKIAERCFSEKNHVDLVLEVLAGPPPEETIKAEELADLRTKLHFSGYEPIGSLEWRRHVTRALLLLLDRE